LLQADHSPPSSPAAQDAEFALNFQQAHCNQGGVYPVVSNEVKVGDELVSKLTLYLPFFDFSGRFRAVLLRDYTGVAITMPTVPRYLYENAERVQAKNPVVDERTKEAHQVQAVSLLGNEIGQVKKTTYRFPPGAARTSPATTRTLTPSTPTILILFQSFAS
jgi:hypothetical protein